jgi:hypothetical protein
MGLTVEWVSKKLAAVVTAFNPVGIGVWVGFLFLTTQNLLSSLQSKVITVHIRGSSISILPYKEKDKSPTVAFG